MRYYYMPPEEIDGEPAKPVRCEYAGTAVVIPSPFRYHKWVEVEYDIGLLIDTRSGRARIDPKTGLEMRLKGKRGEFQLDAEKNTQMDAGDIGPPANYMDMSEDLRGWIGRAKFGPENQFLKSETDVKHQHDREMQRMREEQAMQIKALKAELEREKAAHLAEMEKDRRKAKLKDS